MNAAAKISAYFAKFSGKTWLVALFFLAWGLGEAYCSSAIAGFSLLPGDLGDGRLNHYFLEHGWLWLNGKPPHTSFWDAPFFYPVRNVMGFSDILLGAAPIYWLFRWLGLDYNDSYLLWYGALGALNWTSMYLFIRKAFGSDKFASGTGAFLFAFCAPRLYHTSHIQLWPQFWTPLFLLALVIFYRNSNANRKKATAALGLATICFVMQFYAGYYLGMFLALGCIVYVAVCLVNRKSRGPFLALLKDNRLLICIFLLAGLALLLPMAWHYWQAKGYFNHARSWRFTTLNTPNIFTWFNIPSLLYSQYSYLGENMTGEHLMGAGYLTIGLCLIGMIRGLRRNQAEINFLWAVLAMFLLISVSVAGFQIFKLFWLIPGVSVLGALTRIFFLFLIPFAMGYAFLADRKKCWLQLLLAAILLAENLAPGQMGAPRARDAGLVREIAAIARTSPLPFLYMGNDPPLWQTSLDAMWASIQAGRPTINGYSSRYTRNYEKLFDARPGEIDPEIYPPIRDLPFLLIYRDGDELKSRVVEPQKG